MIKKIQQFFLGVMFFALPVIASADIAYTPAEEFLFSNSGTFAIIVQILALAIIALVIFFIIRSVRRNKKKKQNDKEE